MNILIDDEQLKSLLENKRNHIGFSWISIFMEIIGGVSFLVTVFSTYSSDTFSNPLKKIVFIFLVLIALFSIGLGIYQLHNNIGPNKYDHKKLYNDILVLNKKKHLYSLIAIKNTFDQYPTKFLLYYDEKWSVDFFPAFRTVETNDLENIQKKLSEYLKIEKSKIEVSFLIEKDNQKKFSEDGQIHKVYDHRYYKATILEFPDNMKNDFFSIDGRKFKWMSFHEMKINKIIMDKNRDVIEIFEQYYN